MSRPDDDRPVAGLASLRDTTPPPSLVPAVMRRIAEPVPVTFWSWLRRPRRFELRLSPLGLMAVPGGHATAPSRSPWVGPGAAMGRQVVPEPVYTAPVAPATHEATDGHATENSRLVAILMDVQAAPAPVTIRTLARVVPPARAGQRRARRHKEPR